jgi:hypothetical protein
VDRTEGKRGMGEIFHHYFGDLNVDRKSVLKCVLKMGHECLDWIALPQNKGVWKVEKYPEVFLSRNTSIILF